MESWIGALGCGSKITTHTRVIRLILKIVCLAHCAPQSTVVINVMSATTNCYLWTIHNKCWVSSSDDLWFLVHLMEFDTRCWSTWLLSTFSGSLCCILGPNIGHEIDTFVENNAYQDHTAPHDLFPCDCRVCCYILRLMTWWTFSLPCSPRSPHPSKYSQDCQG